MNTILFETKVLSIWRSTILRVSAHDVSEQAIANAVMNIRAIILWLIGVMNFKF